MGRLSYIGSLGTPMSIFGSFFPSPPGYFLAVCMSMTSNHPAGEKLIRIPGNTILTNGTARRGPFVTDHDSTLFIFQPQAA